MSKMNNLFIEFQEILKLERERAKLEQEYLAVIGLEDLAADEDMVLENAADHFFRKTEYILSKEEKTWMKSLSS
tara:strand:- start:4515 stop:4736 length:222 start_codon:yes stop_codon:yes gene_type:complete